MKHVTCEAILGVCKITTWKPKANHYFYMDFYVSSMFSINQDLAHVIIQLNAFLFLDRCPPGSR